MLFTLDHTAAYAEDNIGEWEAALRRSPKMYRTRDGRQTVDKFHDFLALVRETEQTPRDFILADFMKWVHADSKLAPVASRHHRKPGKSAKEPDIKTSAQQEQRMARILKAQEEKKQLDLAAATPPKVGDEFQLEDPLDNAFDKI